MYVNRWMFRKREYHSKAIARMLDIFDVIGILTSNKLSQASINEINSMLIAMVIERSGLVPPSECTITLHELLHLIDQSIAVGCPRFSNLYKFEKVNKFLKSMLKNVAKGFASIMKNYMEKESIFMQTAIQLSEMESVEDLQKFLPTDTKSMKNIKSFLQKIHIDYDEDDRADVVDIDSSNIVHFYGDRKFEKFNSLLFAYILHNALEYPSMSAPEDSLLKRLFDEWKSGTGSKKPEAFLNFLKKSFNRYLPMTNHSLYMKYNKIILDMTEGKEQDSFRSDFEFLAKCFSPVGEDELFPEDHLLFTYVIFCHFDVKMM
jgi:hypothetical protein